MGLPGEGVETGSPGGILLSAKRLGFPRFHRGIAALELGGREGPPVDHEAFDEARAPRERLTKHV